MFVSSIVGAYQGMPEAERGGWNRRWKMEGQMSRAKVKGQVAPHGGYVMN